MSTIEEIEDSIYGWFLSERSKQVFQQVKRQKGRYCGSDINKRTYKLLRKFNNKFPRGRAFRRLVDIRDWGKSGYN